MFHNALTIEKPFQLINIRSYKNRNFATESQNRRKREFLLNQKTARKKGMRLTSKGGKRQRQRNDEGSLALDEGSSYI